MTTKPQVGCLHSPLPAVSSRSLRCVELRLDRPECELDVLRDGRQKAALVASNRVSGHAQSLRELALRETEEEPSFPKLPAGQSSVRLPRRAFGSQSEGPACYRRKTLRDRRTLTPILSARFRATDPPERRASVKLDIRPRDQNKLRSPSQSRRLSSVSGGADLSLPQPLVAV